MKYKYLIYLIPIVLSSAFADTGMAFLNSEVTPSCISTAQTYYLTGNSPDNTNYNPAALLYSEKVKFQISYRKYINDGQIGNFAVSNKIDSHVFGVNISYLFIDGFEGRDVPSVVPKYEFDSRSLIAGIFYSYDLNILSLGFNAKYLYEKIEYTDAAGYSFSIGVFSRDFISKGLNLSISVNDIGTMEKLENKSAELPTNILSGVSYKYDSEYSISVSLAVSEKFIFNDSELESYTGMEVGYDDMVFARFGYRLENEGMPYSLGLGFKIDKYQIDYSFTPFSEDVIDSSHCLGITYTL